MSLEDVITRIRELEAERTAYKNRLEAIRKIAFDRIEPNKEYKIRQILSRKIQPKEVTE